MEPLPAIAAGVGLVVGVVLAWAIRGRQLGRQQQTHAAQRRGYEEDAAKRQVRIETLEVDRETVQGELERTHVAMGESEVEWSHDRDVARELLAKAEARAEGLSAELDRLREQLLEAHRDVDLQKQAGRELEDQLAAAGQQLQVVGEQLVEQQQELAAARQQHDRLADQLEAGDGLSKDRPRRWRISTFFEG